MKNAKRLLFVVGPALLVLAFGPAGALPPRITWNPNPLVTEAIAPGDEASYTVTLKNTGLLPILAGYQPQIVVQGAIDPDEDIVRPKFPNPFKPGQSVTFGVNVSIPDEAPAGEVTGSLMLKPLIRNKVVDLWRAEALAAEITVNDRVPSIGGSYPLNDTGITRCANATTNGLPCPVDGFPGQDAEYGRDVTHNDPSDGHAGFSFTKLDANGNALPASASAWSCVQDNVTGRVWEVKTDDGGLRDKDWTYSWYNPDASTNGGFAGYEDYAYNCFDPGRCDTHKYVADVNAQGLCGANDWRLPSQFELLSIVSNDRYNPAIDSAWFPNISPSVSFWSSSPYAAHPDYAWHASFSLGLLYGYPKRVASPVRLVRGGQGLGPLGADSRTDPGLIGASSQPPAHLARRQSPTPGHRAGGARLSQVSQIHPGE